jgi:hypothetical protein
MNDFTYLFNDQELRDIHKCLVSSSKQRLISALKKHQRNLRQQEAEETLTHQYPESKNYLKDFNRLLDLEAQETYYEILGDQW